MGIINNTGICNQYWFAKIHLHLYFTGFHYAIKIGGKKTETRNMGMGQYL